MIPNITHGNGFYGLLSYLLLAKDSQSPRHEATLIGGTLTGQTVGELTAEFGLIRRLRPNAEKVVMHHSLSYAPGENPSDEQILRDAQRYLEHMELDSFPHAIVLHRDKGCIHPHIAISKIGANREWFDARLDMPHSQIAAGLVEREFGLVEVPRPHKQKWIDKAWEKLTQERPELRQIKPAPHPAEPLPAARAERLG
ncbi:MAG: relaxase/mobilization nuclease domain-containing protein, partial [Verrucomicrobiota bacterium]